MRRNGLYGVFGVTCTAFLSVIVSTGCASRPGAGGGLIRQRAAAPIQSDATATKEELHDKLDQFEDLFEAVIRRAGDDLVQADGSRRVKRLTLVWQMRLLPMARNALSQDNPLGGLLDLWSLCVRMRQFLVDGEGKNLFGDHQEIAVQAAGECVDEIEKIGKTVLSNEMWNRARERVEAVAKEHPLRGDFSGTEVRASLQTGEKDQILQGVLAIPLTPFRWLGGVDEGAQAIKGFTVVAARLTDVVEGFASDARLQTQLLLLETEDLETVKSTVASLERVSKSTERLAASAEKLTGAVEDVNGKNSGLRETVQQTRQLVDSLDPAGKSVAAAAEAWAQTAKSIQEMVASFHRPADGEAVHPAGPSSESKSAPYDINDYRRAAEAMTQTAQEMQKVIADLRGFSESGSTSKRLDEVSKQLQGILTESTDRATWRAVQVAVIVILLAAAYRWVAVRWIRPRAG